MRKNESSAPDKNTSPQKEDRQVKDQRIDAEKISDIEIKAKTPDPLLACLTYLTAHFGRKKTPEALIAGLAYDKRGMGPNLFCEAAERIGLNAQITQRKALKDIPRAVLPAVLILRGNQACVLLSREDGIAHIYLPETNAEKRIPLNDLEKDYQGYAVFVHPRSEFTNPETVHMMDTDRHWFWSLVKENRNIYVMSLIGAVFINLFALTSPIFIMNVYDRVIPNNAIETGWALGLGALTIFLFDFIMRTLRAYLIDLAGRKIDVIAGQRIYYQVLNMKMAQRPKSSGSFASMLRDFDAVRDFFTSATITGLVDLPFTIFFLFIIYQLGGGIAFALLTMILIVVAIGVILQSPLKAMVRKSSQSSEAKHGLLVESIHGMETIKAVSGDRRFRARYGDYLGENAAYGQRSRFISGLGVNIASYLQQIASIIIVLFGMYMIRDGVLTVGGLIACVMLGGRAIAPIGQIANLMTRYHQANSALKTLDNIMKAPVERPPHKQFLHRAELKGGIRFQNVMFSYPNAGRNILERVSFSIKPGEKVGIIGRIGSGKSTIVRLLLGLYEPDNGTIMLDETDMRQIDPADYRRHMAYIAQDVILFTGSVRDNIALGNPHASDAQILEAAKLAGVDDFISKHPMGYDAPVGESGSNLSGGQRQAVALARAILGNPAMLICDEPTNAMDTHTEMVFQDYVNNHSKDKSLILITHRNNLLHLVDRLILIDQGTILMDAPRDDVIKALQGGKIEVNAQS